MSLETKVEALTASVNELTVVLQRMSKTPATADSERPEQVKIKLEQAEPKGGESPLETPAAEAEGKNQAPNPAPAQGLNEAEKTEAAPEKPAVSAEEVVKAQAERQKLCTQYFRVLQATGRMSSLAAKAACANAISAICGEGVKATELPYERHGEFVAYMTAKIEEAQND